VSDLLAAVVLREAHRLLAPGPASRLVLVTVWARGRALRRALGTAARARPAAWGGLTPLDPTPDLLHAGFAPTRGVQLARGGYPSLVLRARRA